MPEYLTRAEAADYLTERGLRISKNTLQKLATVRGGPAYCIFGNRALHKPADLDAWAASRMSKIERPGTGKVHRPFEAEQAGGGVFTSEHNDVVPNSQAVQTALDRLK